MSSHQDKQASKTIVIGDGWAALGAVGFLAQDGREIHWIAGTGARIIPAASTLEAGPGALVWKELASRMGVGTGVLHMGRFLREFRNKSFREPVWAKSPTVEMKTEVRDEELWAPERPFAGVLEARFETPLAEVEDEIRKLLLAMPNVRRLEGVPIQGFRFEGEGKDSHVRAVVLGSGEEIAASHVIYADRWSELTSLEGLPKPLTFLRGRDAVGVLQAIFNHSERMPAGLEETFYGPVQKESGEDFQRNVMGWFSSDGSWSVWTVMVNQAEVEDNHEIAKKLRRLKQALEKMFGTAEWLPPGKADFQSNVQREQVRFEESVVFSAGKPPTEPVLLPKAQGIHFLTDGYGPSSALHQVALALGEELSIRIQDPAEWIAENGGVEGISPSVATDLPATPT